MRRAALDLADDQVAELERTVRLVQAGKLSAREAHEIIVAAQRDQRRAAREDHAMANVKVTIEVLTDEDRQDSIATRGPLSIDDAIEQATDEAARRALAAARAQPE